MNTDYITLEELKKLYPDEWVLLGNPEMEDTSVLGGTVLFHSKDKKEVFISAEIKQPVLIRLPSLLQAT